VKNIIIAVVIIGLAIYSAVLYSKNQELNRNLDTIIQVASEELDTQSSIDSCTESAYSTYIKDWNTACSSLGYGAGCMLPSYKSDRIDQMYKEAQERCITRYK
jgi:hypothetical protein